MNIHERAAMLAGIDLDFPLSAGDRDELEDHLLGCPDCRATAARLREDAGSLRAISAVDPAPALRAEFAAAIHRPQPITSLVFQDLRPFLRMAVAAALVAALVAGLLAAGLVGVGSPQPGLHAAASAAPPSPSAGISVVAGKPGRQVGACTGATSLALGFDAAYVACGGQLERFRFAGGAPDRLVDGIGDVAVEGSTVWGVGSHGLVGFDEGSSSVTSAAPVSGGTAVAADRTAIWVVRTDANQVLRVDPTSFRVVATIPVGHDPVDVLSAFGRVWVSNRADRSISLIDPSTNRVAATITVGAGPLGIAATTDAIWVANDADGTVSRINPTTLATSLVSVEPDVSTSDLPSIAASGRSVWVVDAHTVRIAEIDPATLLVARQIAVPEPVPQNGQIDLIAANGGSLWVLDGTDFLKEILVR